MDNQTRPHTALTVASVSIALLMAAASILALAGDVYPTTELRLAFLTNDVINLAFGVPLLLVVTWSAWRGHLLGWVFWPGALFYVVYNYVALYAALPFGVMAVLALILVVLSAYTTAAILLAADVPTVQAQLKDAVPDRLAGGVLAVLGGLYLLLALGGTAGGLSGEAATTEIGVYTADLVIAPAWVLGGVLLWRRQPFGYVLGGAMLFHAASLFAALIAFLILQPLLTDAPFALVDLAVIIVMSLVCFVPFGLFTRGALAAGQAERSSTKAATEA